MSASETRSSAHFAVDGGGFTEIVRNIMLSDRPNRAWCLIAEGLLEGDGNPERVARGVLDGTKRLANPPDDPDAIIVVDDLDERYLRDLHYIYAGRIRFDDGTWMRPRAVLGTLGGRGEARAATAGEVVVEHFVSPGAAMREWDRRTAEFYCGPRETAIKVGKDWVIWEPCGERPHWWATNRNPAEAIEEARKAGRCLDEVERSHELVVLHEMEELTTPEDFAEVKDTYHAAVEERRVRETERIRRVVRERAGDDTFVLVIPADERTEDGIGLPREPVPERRIIVPRKPFWCWALHRSSTLRHLMPKWDTVSRSGFKLPLDDPYHTDWMLGAGLSLDTDYGIKSPVSSAAWKEMSRIQEALGGFEVAVLVDNGPVVGQVGKEIAVLPDLGPDHTEIAMASKAIIAEKGGSLAHLSLVGAEAGLTVVRDPDALRNYREGEFLVVDPSNGTVRLQG